MYESHRYYKFRAINKYFIGSIVSPSIFFARSAELNNPFDCQINLPRALSQLPSVKLAHLGDILEKEIGIKDPFPRLQARLSRAAICAFSRRSDETLLWSHYADQHKGVCVLYEFPEVFFRRARGSIMNKIVQYKSRLIEDDFGDSLSSGTSESIDEFMNELVSIFLSTKSMTWRYENEARMIRSEPGTVKIDPEFIKEICFGLQTPKAYIMLIKSLARAHCRSAVLTRMVRDRSDFGFSMRPI